MPTKRKRHAITETEPVEAALDELRRESGVKRVNLGELVLLGANAKVAELRATQGRTQEMRKSLADRIRAGEALAEVEKADEVRRSGWARD